MPTTSTLRIAAVSDIHGNLAALHAVLDDIARRGADLIVDCGDLLSGPLWPRETADLLMRLDWPSIAGNHERQLLACAQSPGGAPDQFAFEACEDRHLAWLAALPASRTPAPDVLMVHGRPENDLDYLLETVSPDAGAAGARLARPQEIATRLKGLDRPQLLLCGHSHQPRVVRHGPSLLVNPGSVGLPAFDDSHGGFHVIETGSPHARYALCERRAGRWSAALLAVDYDWDAAARKARAEGAADWAAWLESGRAM